MPEFMRRLRQYVPSDELLQIPSVTIVLRDEHDRVLLVRHVESEQWLLVGGTIEPGEGPADAAVREMWEETGFLVKLTKLVGVFGGPEYIVRYRNGDITSYVTTVFEAVAERDLNAAKIDERELLEIRFMSRDETGNVAVAPWVSEVLAAVFRQDERAIFREPSWTPPL
jgi:8-oxo-dGTP pyrophosphatase MutT (NUDIX family)